MGGGELRGERRDRAPELNKNSRGRHSGIIHRTYGLRDALRSDLPLDTCRICGILSSLSYVVDACPSEAHKSSLILVPWLMSY